MQCVAELDAPHYLHQFVKKAVEIAMDDEKKRIPLCVQLLRRAASDVLPHHQLVLGLKRLRKGLGELQLDVPRAEELLAQVCEALEAAKLVTEDELRVWRV